MTTVNNGSDNLGLGHYLKEEKWFLDFNGKSELNTQLLVSLGSVVHVSKFSLQTVESPPGETVEKETTTSEHGRIFTSHLLFKTEHQTANPIDWSKTFKAKMFFAFL